MYTLNIAYGTIVALIVVLVLVFLFLLGYTMWTRAKKRYWHDYKIKFRDYFMPMLFDFVEGEPDHTDADELIFKLTKRSQDVSYFLELLDEMSDVLKGKDRDKLDLLIEHDIFYSFYRGKLFSFSKNSRLQACVYFGKGISIGDRVTAQLIAISKSSDIKLHYAAAKALQSSDSVVVRRNALIRLFKREDTSDLMVAELLHYFHKGSNGQRDNIGKAFKDILFQDEISTQKKRVVVLYLAYKNYYEYGPFLLEYLKKMQYSPQKAPLIRGLVEALGQLHVSEAVTVLRQYIEIEDKELRIKCIKALGRFGGKENLAFLAKLLIGAEFSVRKAILEVLVQNTKFGFQLIDKFLLTNQQYIDHYKRSEESPEGFSEIVSSIQSTVKGIEIMLSRKLTNGHF